jgi:hypothetical protein
VINTAAYQAEILRGAIQSIPRGQFEGALALGLHRWSSLRHVILPQAMILGLRPLGNELIVMIKASAIASLVTIYDLMGATRMAFARSFDLSIYLYAALIYLLHVPTNVVIGTSLFQIIFVTAFTTVLQAYLNQTVDIILALVLMVGGVIGAQFGAAAGLRLRGDQLRALLGLLVLAVGLRMAFELVITPASIYTLTAVEGGGR